MENGPFLDDLPRKRVVFSSYVSLPSKVGHIMGKYEIVGIQFIHSYSWWVSELSTIKKRGFNMISPSTNGI